MMMAEIVHEDLYKKKGKSIADIKSNTKSWVKVNQTQQRDRLILNKRLKIDTLTEAETVLSAQEELEKVTHATHLLKQGKRIEALISLRRSFARDPNNAKFFLSQRNDGLQALQSSLLSKDSEVLHAAAWCAINLTAGVSLSVGKMMHFSPLLIQFLQGTDPLMQELCAWAIGNLAADSHKHRKVLQQQGCIPALLALVSSTNHLTFEERSQSVLFALVNFAKDEDYIFIRCMYDSSIFDHLIMMLKTINVASSLCFEIGWLINYVYGRRETYQRHENHYRSIFSSLIVKLSQVFNLEERTHKDQIMLLYQRTVGNIIGLSPDIALMASDDPVFMPTVFSCLTSEIQLIQRETLWMLANFMAEPSCRVFVMCQPRFLNKVFQLCLSHDEDTALTALYILEAASKVSVWMCQYLVEHGIVNLLIKLLARDVHDLMDAALDILTDLVVTTVQGKTVLLETGGLSQLQAAATSEKYPMIMDKAKYLLNLL